jgi:hypothetical protein
VLTRALGAEAAVLNIEATLRTPEFHELLTKVAAHFSQLNEHGVDTGPLSLLAFTKRSFFGPSGRSGSMLHALPPEGIIAALPTGAWLVASSRLRWTGGGKGGCWHTETSAPAADPLPYPPPPARAAVRVGVTTDALHAALFVPEGGRKEEEEAGGGGREGEHLKIITWRALLLVVIFLNQRVTCSPYAETQTAAAVALLRESLNFRGAGARAAPAGFEFKLGGGLLCPLLVLFVASDLAERSLQCSFFSFGAWLSAGPPRRACAGEQQALFRIASQRRHTPRPPPLPSTPQVRSWAMRALSPSCREGRWMPRLQLPG